MSRPFAFAVQRAPENGADEWRLFLDEGKAREAAEQLDGDYEGLYRVGDRRSAIEGRDAAYKKAWDIYVETSMDSDKSSFECIKAIVDAVTGAPAQAVPEDVEALGRLADSMGFGRTHDMLRRVIAALASQPSPAATVEEEMVPKRLLNGRDDFLVSKGLWSEFVDSLPRTPNATVDPGARPGEEHRTEYQRGYSAGVLARMDAEEYERKNPHNGLSAGNGDDCAHRIAVTPRNGAPHGAGFACSLSGGHCIARPGCGYQSHNEPQAAPVSDNDLYYLKSIQRQLEVVKESLADTASFTLSGMAFSDTVDWLDCFIDARERALALSRPLSRGEA